MATYVNVYPATVTLLDGAHLETGETTVMSAADAALFGGNLELVE